MIRVERETAQRSDFGLKRGNFSHFAFVLVGQSMETGGRDDVESICRARGSCNAGPQVLRLSFNFFLFMTEFNPTRAHQDLT